MWWLGEEAMNRYARMAQQVLEGRRLAREQARQVLEAADEELKSLLLAAFEVRRRYFGRRVKMVMIRNARSGHCGEDCHYCSQSAISSAAIPTYPLQPLESLVEGARRAMARGARRYCVVTSGRGPSRADLERLCRAASAIKREFPEIELCVSPGIIGEREALALKEAGVGWINHNLNTSENFHARICTTHSYHDRVRTIAAARKVGLAVCSGGIVGMGETDEDILDLGYALAKFQPESLPVNFLQPIPGTPLAGASLIQPQKALKVLCLFRFLCGRSDLRAASGREKVLGQWQGLALYPANSIFIDGYLTTSGDPAEQARRMIVEQGFEPQV